MAHGGAKNRARKEWMVQERGKNSRRSRIVLNRFTAAEIEIEIEGAYWGPLTVPVESKMHSGNHLCRLVSVVTACS